jgi:predicted Zn-dependent protease with MMP-like domain
MARTSEPDARLSYTVAVRSSDFDALVEAAFRRIPARFRRRMQNVAVIVEPEPSASQLAAGRVPRGDTLLGLYEGRPLPVRSSFEAFSMPDRITLFQGPIERAARGPADVPRVIADTLWHEIAHYFGMDERQVRAAERRRSLRPRGGGD